MIPELRPWGESKDSQQAPNENKWALIKIYCKLREHESCFCVLEPEDASSTVRIWLYQRELCLEDPGIK